MVVFMGITRDFHPLIVVRGSHLVSGGSKHFSNFSSLFVEMIQFEELLFQRGCKLQHPHPKK